MSCIFRKSCINACTGINYPWLNYICKSWCMYVNINKIHMSWIYIFVSFVVFISKHKFSLFSLFRTDVNFSQSLKIDIQIEVCVAYILLIKLPIPVERERERKRDVDVVVIHPWTVSTWFSGIRGFARLSF